METLVGCHYLTSPRHAYEDRYRLLGATHPRVRVANRGEIYAVMDGVGGAPEGMQAAQLVADGLARFFEPETPGTEQALNDVLVSIDAAAHARGHMPGTDRPLAACAATVAWFSPSKRLHVLHAGDTVALRWDGETLRQLTREHGSGRAIDRYVGQGAGFRLDRTSVELEEGEIVCLISDGVTKAMRVHDIADVVREIPDPVRIAKELVTRARNRGSTDDITAVVIELLEW